MVRFLWGCGCEIGCSLSCYFGISAAYWINNFLGKGIVMHQHQVRVYYEDTDAGGIVYYANYLKFMERARTEWLRGLGFEQDTLMEQSVAFVVKRVEMHNYAPARFNQLLSIESHVVELKGASMTFQQIIKNEQGDKLVSGDIQVACVDLATMKPKRLPRTLLGEISRVI
jgi:acyl-CoA thioester hydrolase